MRSRPLGQAGMSSDAQAGKVPVRAGLGVLRGCPLGNTSAGCRAQGPFGESGDQTRARSIS